MSYPLRFGTTIGCHWKNSRDQLFLWQQIPHIWSDLIDGTSVAWKIDVMQATYLPIDAHHICRLLVVEFWAVWSFVSLLRLSHDRKHQVASQRLAGSLEARTRSSNASYDGETWKSLWNTYVPEKMRFFQWRLALHSLPTNDVRRHGKMASSGACSICGA